jgi:hypothetical protein
MTMRKNVVPTAGEAVPSKHALMALTYRVQAMMHVCRLAVRDAYSGTTETESPDLPAIECALEIAGELASDLADQIDLATE